MNVKGTALAIILGTVCAGGTASAAPGRVAGPHGGRIIEAGTVRVEFVLDQERRARVYRLDAKGAAADLGDVAVTLKAKQPGGLKAVKLDKTSAGPGGSAEKVLHAVSAAPLPSPDGYQLVVSVKAKGKTTNVRFDLLEHACGECKLPEYACICGH